MKCSMADHWFFKEEYKWRTLASAVWTWITTFPILGVFVFGFSVDLSKHIFILYDFICGLLSIYTWLICIVIACLSVPLVFLHSWYYTVASVFPQNRLENITRTLRASNALYGLMNTAFSIATAHLTTYLISEKSCGSWFIFMSFGTCVGVVNGTDCILDSKSSFIFPYAQEAKFLSFKCRLPCILSRCSMRSLRFLYYFLIIYYIVGFLLKDLVAFFVGEHAGKIHLHQVWKLFQAIHVVWNLWLLGTLLFLLWEVSWQLLNIYHTQSYPFLSDSYFPETKCKLLVENLDEFKPPIVQHLGYQFLSTIAKRNPAKRQRIFALSRRTEYGQPIMWNKILSNSLNCIKQLTDNINEYLLTISDGIESHSYNSNVSPGTTSKANKTGFAIGSVSGRRPVSVFSSAADVSSPSLPAHNGDDNSSRSIGVPAPRLLTMFSKDRATDEVSAVQSVSDVPEAAPLGKMQNRLAFFANNVIKLPLTSYFLETIPSWALLNIYRRNLVIHWVMQSLSYLCAASLTEDKFGVVQGNLCEVIICFIELMKALEKLSKMSTSPSLISKLHFGLCSEVRASLHRIVDAYGDSLKSVNLSPENRGHLRSFLDYEQ